MITKDNISNIKEMIIKKINPKKIILFGSYAYGNPNETSDLDIMIVYDGLIPKNKIALQLSKELFPRDYGLDLIVITSKEIEDRVNRKFVFWNDIIKNGIKLYEQW